MHFFSWIFSLTATAQHYGRGIGVHLRGSPGARWSFSQQQLHGAGKAAFRGGNGILDEFCKDWVSTRETGLGLASRKRMWKVHLEKVSRAEMKWFLASTEKALKVGGPSTSTRRVTVLHANVDVNANTDADANADADAVADAVWDIHEFWNGGDGWLWLGLVCLRVGHVLQSASLGQRNE